MNKIILSKHAIERIQERYGVCSNNAKQILNQAYQTAIEIHGKGKGRSFKNQKENLVMVTDTDRKIIVTVYNASGKEQYFNEQEQLEASIKDSAHFNDASWKAMYEEFKVINLQMYIEIETLKVEKDEMVVKISKDKLKLLTMDNAAEQEMLYADNQLDIMRQSFIKKEISELEKKRFDMLKHYCKQLGLNIKGFEGFQFVYKTRKEMIGD